MERKVTTRLLIPICYSGNGGSIGVTELLLDF